MRAKPNALFDMDGFEEFWRHYPRKEAKIAARKAWARLAFSSAEIPSLLEAMRTWIEIASRSRQWSDPSWIPHPSTWLNQRRWEGDPPPAVRSSPSAQVGLSTWAGPGWSARELRPVRRARKYDGLRGSVLRGGWLPYWELRWVAAFERKVMP